MLFHFAEERCIDLISKEEIKNKSGRYISAFKVFRFAYKFEVVLEKVKSKC